METSRWLLQTCSIGQAEPVHSLMARPQNIGLWDPILRVVVAMLTSICMIDMILLLRLLVTCTIVPSSIHDGVMYHRDDT